MYSGSDSGYCDTPEPSSNDLQCPTSIVETTMEDKIKDCLMSGPSCRALRHAVMGLNRLDDFSCEHIGNGFYSKVYKVTHRVTGQVMVLKMNQLRSNRGNMLKEVQLMNQLSHPNILGFMGVCVHEGQLHALTEYINGGSLEQLIANTAKELSFVTRMKLALDIARGMQYLHSKDVFHRDLTSKNVLIRHNEKTGEMAAVVGDFGLAAKIPRSGYRLPTVGSPWWMSPECLKGQWYDQRSDVFSYGIILCEIIACVNADPDILPRTQNFGLDYLAMVELCSQNVPVAPPEFLKLAFSCCNFEPKNRPTFNDIVAMLEKIIVSLSTPEPGIGLLVEARSEECLLDQHLSHTVTTPNKQSKHRKLHRRSLSEDVGTAMYSLHSAPSPSEKARCHYMTPSQEHLAVAPPLKHIGESMCREDPYYEPSADKLNPFASLSQFKGVKKILAGTNSSDLFSSCCELPSPYVGDEPCSSSKRDESLRNSSRLFCSSSKELNVGNMKSETLPNSNQNSVNSLNDVWIRRSPSSRSSIDLSKSEGVEDSIVVEPVVKPSELCLKNQSKCSSISPVSCGKLSESNNSPPSCSTPKNLTDVPKSTLTFEYVSKFVKINSRKSYLNSNPKAVSLPCSPTFLRKQPCVSESSDDCFKCISPIGKNKSMSDDGSDCTSGSELADSKSTCTVYSNLLPLFKSRTTNLSSEATILDCAPLRSCSSSSNVSSLAANCSNTSGLNLLCPTSSTTVPGLLRRRGSCESGFFSSVGEDFCVPGMDTLSARLHTASSVTLSSSSAASSLFLDSTGDDIATPLLLSAKHLHHFPPPRSSSIYTDSSEDVSSLASGDPPIWDEKKPQQISKIVEYFERKQSVNSGYHSSNGLSQRWDLNEPSNRYQLHQQLRRSYLQESTLIKPSELRKHFSLTGANSSTSTNLHFLDKPKRSTHQRLTVCEGAVRSKLQLFDKKN
ncbi:uncharacterized protein cdi isoform X2 [Bemisia tabaci]|uniref:uncharacterized protein cdi isoform X2 n=1 Tax=Bemisia tabaci TaxID=7038 RepID=UPI0008F9C451|nr:PREDICTED: serine/threonine-protein kinase ATG1 isoform X2 [Bemisia tabaci]